MDNCPHCGTVLEEKPHNRSTPQNNRYHAMVAATYNHWREDHEFRPKNIHHLRKWLEMKAGHFIVTKTARINSVDPDKLYALMRAFMVHSEDETLFLELDGNLLVQKKALSIKYEALDSKEFSRLKDAVADVITIELGVDPDELLKQTERAA